MFFTRLFRPFITFDGDELSGGAEPVEAPIADQPDTPDVTPEATEPGTTDAEVSDTPTETEAPEDDESFTDADADALPEDVQTRYREMQADYTRKTQALAERHAELDSAVSFVTDLVSDEPNETQEAVFRTLAERLGYDLEEDDDDEAGDTENVDGDEEDTRTDRERWVDDQRAASEAKAEQDRQAAHEAHLDTVEAGITESITALAKADGFDLDEAEIDVIFDGVLALPAEADGPAVKAAYERYKAATKADRDRWVKSKSAATLPGGLAAGEKPDLSTAEGRIAHSARNIEATLRS